MARALLGWAICLAILSSLPHALLATEEGDEVLLVRGGQVQHVTVSLPARCRGRR